MSISIIISHENDETLKVSYFVEQLKEKWPKAEVYFISDPKAHSLLQFQTFDDFGLLGDFLGTGVSYTTSGGRIEDAQFALWYRSIVPAEWKLRVYDSAMTFDFMFLTNESTEEQIIVGFDIPFDISKHK
ncbi:MAG: hypothetical protein HY866_23510 [Chloroflexi bacterium]|nr:hypothetical protein [Chloroflexota bacterium]